jgi:pimeloyl-ACP methyl ester carboxylesterase
MGKMPMLRKHFCRYTPSSMHRVGSLFILLVLGTSTGCNHSLAARLVEAQNFRNPMRGKDASDQILKDHLVSQQLRIRVRPAASINVWIVDPIPSQVSVSLSATPGGYTFLKIGNSATSAPTSAPTRGVKGKPRSTTQPTSRLATLFNDPRTTTTLPFGSGASTQSTTPKATLFLLHGITEGKEWIPYQFWATTLRVAGFRVVTLDLRGHGRSTGNYITYGALESSDLVQVLDELEKQKLIIGNVGVLGGSYGASVAIQWASIDPRVKAVVALEPFDSVRHAAHDSAPTILGDKKKYFSDRDIQKAITQAGEISGFDPDLRSPLVAISTCTTPILLIHGKDDTFLSPRNSERLHNAAKDHSRLILVDKATHIDLWHKAFPVIYRESNAFFSEHLTTGPTHQPPATSPSTEQPSPRLTPIPQPSTRGSPRTFPTESTESPERE